MEKYLEAGKIVNTHGVRGDVRAESWCDSPAVLAGLPAIYLKKADGNWLTMKITRGSVHKGMALLKLEGIDDINDAVRFKNMVIYAAREDIPAREGSYFIADLIGLPVVDADDPAVVYGKVKNIVDIAGRQLYEVENDSGVHLVPAVKEFIVRVDPETGVFLRPIEGLLG